MTNAPALTAPEAENLDAVIGQNVHNLMWAAREKQSAIAPQWGMTQSALSLKLRGQRPWFASEIAAAARHYRVSVAALFTELPETPTLDYGSRGSVIEVDFSTRRRAQRN